MVECMNSRVEVGLISSRSDSTSNNSISNRKSNSLPHLSFGAASEIWWKHNSNGSSISNSSNFSSLSYSICANSEKNVPRSAYIQR